MIEAAVAQLRYATSLMTGRPFNVPALRTIVKAMVDAHREFGSVGAEATELVAGPYLDAKTAGDLALRRFRSQARRGRRDTRYYRSLFDSHDIDPGRLTLADIGRIPMVTRADLEADPDDFAATTRTPWTRFSTTGTTGSPFRLRSSQYDLDVMSALEAMSLIQTSAVAPGDVMCLTQSPASAAHTVTRAACAAVGAKVTAVWGRSAEEILGGLRRGSRNGVTVLSADTSMLGAVVEAGLTAGARPGDFGVHHIFVGGEIVTSGLRRRCQRIFGDARIVEGFGSTELGPFVGNICSEAHMHFNPFLGLLETRPVDGELEEGGLATLVMTPFPPFRETTILLRYDTGDLVRRLTSPPTCDLRHIPATGLILGKRSVAARHRDGWTTSRDVLEALEALDVVPLPARCGFWTDGARIAVEVMVRQTGAGVRTEVGDALESNGVPLGQLHLTTDPAELLRPRFLRCDQGIRGGIVSTNRPTAAMVA